MCFRSYCSQSTQLHEKFTNLIVTNRGRNVTRDETRGRTRMSSHEMSFQTLVRAWRVRTADERTDVAVIDDDNPVSGPPGRQKRGPQVSRILFLLLPTTSDSTCLQRSRNLGSTLLSSPESSSSGCSTLRHISGQSDPKAES